MALRQTIELVDDLDESVIEDGRPQTFSLNGTAYEIDRSPDNAEALRDALAPFIQAGRRVSRSSSRSKHRPAQDLNAIREWAHGNGYDVSDRGRIAAHIVAAYRSA